MAARRTRTAKPVNESISTVRSGLGAGTSHQSLADRAHAELEELIVTLKLAPGSIWNEQALSDLIGVGRTPTREALKRLEGAHLIEIVPRHGLMVAKLNIYQQLLVAELRSPLEVLVSRWAALRSTPQEKGQLLELAEALEDSAKASDAGKYLRNVFMANEFIAQCARNPFASQALAPLHALARRFFYSYHAEQDLRTFSELHGARARAVAQGDADAAAGAAKALMDQVDVFTRGIVAHNLAS